MIFLPMVILLLSCMHRIRQTSIHTPSLSIVEDIENPNSSASYCDITSHYIMFYSFLQVIWAGVQAPLMGFPIYLKWIGTAVAC
jgi:hypothetical protein